MLSSTLFFSVLMGLFLFGVVYDQVVSWLERTNRQRGFVSLLVVAGVAVTVGASIPLIGLQHAEMLLALFAASGLPMVSGSIWRHMQRRAAEEAQAQELAKRMLSEVRDDE